MNKEKNESPLDRGQMFCLGISLMNAAYLVDILSGGDPKWWAFVIGIVVAFGFSLSGWFGAGLQIAFVLLNVIDHLVHIVDMLEALN